MNAHAQVAPSVPATVNFHGQPLITFLYNGEPYAAMKPIVEGMGLQWAAQEKRIKRNPILSTCMSMMDIQMPGDDQRREVIALPLKLLNGWLFGVDVNRVKPALRETILAYQCECYDVLYRHWHREPAAPSPKPTHPEQVEIPFSLPNTRLLVTIESGRVVHVEVVGEGAVVVDTANEDEITRFLDKHVAPDLLPFAAIHCIARMGKMINRIEAGNQAC
ncbi:phage antirepressor N-terminal domain-containing protein [Methylomagnum ishizawai]|uniref:phage antirepressor N-terminal domain-containing protein n=1 Tax=Methylomagnum ishizawai TaxID=1760988 RepID=UPI001C328DCD|nr:phage antirepressor N-terminal domain-containing protein [Methylomagnum ishizawai]BBL75394.1 hypothetical protein MishRS11D_24920 [Methylomagnum ishizawai]